MFAFGFMIAKLHDLPYIFYLKMYEENNEELYANLSSLCNICIYFKMFICFITVNRVETRTCLTTSFKPTNQNFNQFLSNKFALSVSEVCLNYRTVVDL